MHCEPFREAVSAGLDGEPLEMSQERLDAHLAGCPACRSWADTAAEVTRRARLAPAAAVPDVTAAVLARLPEGGRAVGRRRRVTDAALRGALLVVGIGQLAVAWPALTGAMDMAGSVHLSHETGAWNLGLAVCFLGVAALPRLAPGSLPFLLSFTALLSFVTVRDLGAGHVHGGRATGHLLLLAGAVLVSVLAFRGRATRTGPRPADTVRWARWRVAAGSTAPATVSRTGPWPGDAVASDGHQQAA
ncbi:zf-HC2 domain-containing protein [Modestobacter sp. VKM Ac-2986]|uniref:zf-HC2 domain-containing protein n=1 Tax=Modestobacter sp. VKM Ac-2986 TaxID=3004140 RepID=UPI0022AB96D2|nr:zf-HC2 domain-containing protein [Modestobacter sp. VKM Ac-2986]MCZ2830969.1 zf-HC2 domain-containing protein [Modestobacter sp. VKM Ac-2986]